MLDIDPLNNVHLRPFPSMLTNSHPGDFFQNLHPGKSKSILDALNWLLICQRQHMTVSRRDISSNFCANGSAHKHLSVHGIIMSSSFEIELLSIT